MPVQDLVSRRYARFVRFLASALVLLGLCSDLGCADKPTGPAGGPAPANPRRMPK
ncbi:MAG: hypothetical protein L0Z62_42900 [Gemmataceae bacterium]|nr:hypothetical protein [Gemmataceae bacterium]